MATTVHVDLVKAARIVEEKGQIVSATVEYVVSGVTGYTTSAEMGRNVLANASIPKYGSTYPTDSTVELYQREWQANEQKDGGKVTCMYRRRSFGSNDEPIETQSLGITGGTSVIQKNTVKNILGEDIECPHPEERSDIEAKNEDQKKGDVSIFSPQATLTIIKQVETFEPGAITDTYVGKTNSSGFQNSGPGEWLCMDGSFTLIAVDSITSAQTYEITFTFQRDREGWDPLIVYTDEDGNIDPRVHVDKYRDDGGKDGWDRPVIYEQIDFNAIFTL